MLPGRQRGISYSQGGSDIGRVLQTHVQHGFLPAAEDTGFVQQIDRAGTGESRNIVTAKRLLIPFGAATDWAPLDQGNSMEKAPMTVPDQSGFCPEDPRCTHVPESLGATTRQSSCTRVPRHIEAAWGKGNANIVSQRLEGVRGGVLSAETQSNAILLPESPRAQDQGDTSAAPKIVKTGSPKGILPASSSVKYSSNPPSAILPPKNAAGGIAKGLSHLPCCEKASSDSPKAKTTGVAHAGDSGSIGVPGVAKEVLSNVFSMTMSSGALLGRRLLDSLPDD